MLDVAAFLLVLTALLAVLNQRVLRLSPTIGLMAMALLLSHLFWELVDELLNAVLFVMVGLQVITLRMPGGLAPALAAFATAIVVALAARWIAVGLPVRLFPAAFRLPPGSPLVLTWGGLRGGISIAMALSLPAGAHRETLIALTYSIVAFSILVQGLTFARLLRATGGGTPPVSSR